MIPLTMKNPSVMEDYEKYRTLMSQLQVIRGTIIRKLSIYPDPKLERVMSKAEARRNRKLVAWVKSEQRKRDNDIV